MIEENQLTKRVWRFLGSRNFSIFLFAIMATFTLMLFVFAFFMPVSGVNNLAFFLPFKILYPLFLLNLLLCMISWLPAVVKQCKAIKVPSTDNERNKFRQKINIALAADESQELKKLQKYFRNRGYRTALPEKGPTLLHAARGRFSPFGTLLFHFSFFILLLGVITSMLFRFEASAPYPEGHHFPGNREYYRFISAAPLASFPRVSFKIDRITAEFWEGRLHFTSMGAEISRNGRKDFLELSNSVKIGGADVTVTAYGFAPVYTLKDRFGNIADSKAALLRVFIPGSREFFEIPGYPHKIFLTFYPDAEKMEKARITNYPPNPIYYLEIFRGRFLVYEGFVRPGEWARFDGLSIAITDLSRWVTIKAVKDPGFYFIWIAFILMISGLILRLLFYKKELLLWRDDEGRLWLAGRFEFCRNLNLGWLNNLAMRLKAGDL